MKVGIDARAILGKRAGIGEYVSQLINHLSKIDRTNIYWLYTNEPLDLVLPNNFIERKIEAQRYLWHLKTALDIKTNNLDVYHSTHSLIIPSILGKKTVLTIHDATSLILPETHLGRSEEMISRFLFKLAIRKAKKIIVPSNSTKIDVLRLTKVKEDKVSVINLGIEHTFNRATKKELALVKKKYNLPKDYILFNATLEPRKNLNGLLRAFDLLISKYKMKIPLVVAGKKGWGYKEFFDLSKELKLDQYIFYLDWVDNCDMTTIYSGAKLFVYPSLYEGFGLPLLSAMKIGIPIVTSRVSSIPEVVGEAAILVDPHNINELASSMIGVVRDEKLAKSLVKKGFAQVRKFSWERTAEQTLKIYKEVNG